MRKLLILSFLLCFTVPFIFAAKSKSKDPEVVLQEGREAFLEYRFEDAEELFDQYRTMMKKAKKEVSEQLEQWESELEHAQNAFDRVQKIVVLDSISVPRKEFYRAYKLSATAGQVGNLSDLGVKSGLKTMEAGYLNEDADFLIIPIWENGEYRLRESRRLLDGSWETIEGLEGIDAMSGDYLYPYLGADGQTFYFANNGEGTMGGLDIFVAQRDPITGEYRQPLNMGMPFNSPYDDLLMVVDEEKGIGWWATERNQLEDDITIYVFVYDEVRKNYPENAENKENFARIIDYKQTWEEDTYGKYGSLIDSLHPKR